MITHSQCDVMRQLLIDLSLAGDVASDPDDETWPARAGFEVPVPDNAITVRDTTGFVHGQSQIDGEVFEHHGLQIRVRGEDEATSGLKARRIWDALKSIHLRTVAVDSARYLVQAVSRSGSILDLGNEPGSQRRIHTINVVASIREL